MIAIRENVPLAELCSYKIGGPARYFCEPSAADELAKIFEWLNGTKLPYFVLGGGTNLLISDDGFPGLVIHPKFMELESGERVVRVGSGILMKDLVGHFAENSFSGLEWAGGLPGTVGGAIRGNAGAFGGEMKDSIVSVTSFNVGTGKAKKRSREECAFGYRDGIFKKIGGEEIILGSVLTYAPGEKEKIIFSVKEKIDFRTRMHPMDFPNIGSMFKNVPVSSLPETVKFDRDKVREIFPVKDDPFPVIPAAFLLSEVGVKDHAKGGAMISAKHPNFIVNTGGATAADVECLIALSRQKVLESFGVLLEEEIQRVP